MNPYITHPLLIPSPKFKNPTTPPLDFLPISNPQISGPDDLMITNRPYLLMRTWTPNSAPVDSSTFRLPQTQPRSTFYYDSLTSETPRRLPVQIRIASPMIYSWRRYAHQPMWRKAGYSQNQVWIHPTSQTRSSTALHIAVTYFSTPSLFSLTSHLFSFKLSIPHSSALVKLQALPYFHS